MVRRINYIKKKKSFYVVMLRKQNCKLTNISVIFQKLHQCILLIIQSKIFALCQVHKAEHTTMF